MCTNFITQVTKTWVTPSLTDARSPTCQKKNIYIYIYIWSRVASRRSRWCGRYCRVATGRTQRCRYWNDAHKSRARCTTRRWCGHVYRTCVPAQGTRTVPSMRRNAPHCYVRRRSAHSVSVMPTVCRTTRPYHAPCRRHQRHRLDLDLDLDRPRLSHRSYVWRARMRCPREIWPRRRGLRRKLVGVSRWRSGDVNYVSNVATFSSKAALTQTPTALGVCATVWAHGNISCFTGSNSSSSARPPYCKSMSETAIEVCHLPPIHHMSTAFCALSFMITACAHALFIFASLPACCPSFYRMLLRSPNRSSSH